MIRMGTTNFISEFTDKRVAVLGAGVTGLAVAEFLVARGSQVFVSDCNSIVPETQAWLSKLGIEFEEGAHSERVFEVDFIVPSPGVSMSSKVIQDARSLLIPVIGDIELASMFVDTNNIIAVTGTVGKTTTTHLIAELLKAHNHNVVVAGNIGTPWISCVSKSNADAIHVVEVSSYQLEHSPNFTPHIGVFTKFSAHHINRHGSVQEYLRLKHRLFLNQGANDFAVFLNENPVPKNLKSQLIRFSDSDQEVLNRSYPEHIKENLAAALRATQCLDAGISLSRLNLDTIVQLEHRIEDLGPVKGVRFYNDSKSTMPQATIAALNALDGQRIVLILGGSNTEPDLNSLVEQIKAQNIERVLLMGESSLPLSLAFKKKQFERFERVSSLSDAIERTFEISPETCLFSPAAPSFDQFSSYVERGETFKKVLASYRAKTMITHSSDQQVPGSLQ